MPKSTDIGIASLKMLGSAKANNFRTKKKDTPFERKRSTSSNT
ncbi:hypothetical protein AGMMS49523_11220 [Endomicrobiia bacterium]|nr:hypothetical protein AGMMS49523_11220 [Endomicrobiia bacterium]